VVLSKFEKGASSAKKMLPAFIILVRLINLWRSFLIYVNINYLDPIFFCPSQTSHLSQCSFIIYIAFHVFLPEKYEVLV
jgi:hypothetical protein